MACSLFTCAQIATIVPSPSVEASDKEIYMKTTPRLILNGTNFNLKNTELYFDPPLQEGTVIQKLVGNEEWGGRRKDEHPASAVDRREAELTVDVSFLAKFAPRPPTYLTLMSPHLVFGCTVRLHPASCIQYIHTAS